MNGPESNYAAWIAKAENDLLNVENNLLASRVPWDTVCFHAQQVAEKLLKAFLVFRGYREIVLATLLISLFL
jgi:HEPN domain-containing protein